MRKLVAFMAVSVLPVLAAYAIFDPPGPATLDLSAIVRDQPFQIVGTKTNSTGRATNYLYFWKDTTATTHFTGSNLLAIIEHSFKTNFPAGSQIGEHFENLVVVDSTGTNVIFDPSSNSVLTTTFDNNGEFESATETQVTTVSSNGVTHSGSYNSTITASITYTYDDTALVTTNQTQFQLKGLMVKKSMGNLKTGFQKIISFEFQGTGGGPVLGVPTILTGTISAKASGAPAPP